MQAQSFDGIIIGSGQHGLVLGAYLAKAGLKVLLLERRLMYGGGLSTEEVTLPGFYHNLHSINHFNLTKTPWYADLGLDVKVPYITPRYEFAQPHKDGTALVFSRNLEETLSSIRRFSEKDAKTFQEWNEKAELMTKHIFLPERFSAPLSEAERRALLEQSSIGREFLALTNMQPFDAVNTLFENERVKVLFLFKLSLFGTVLYEALNKPSPLGSTIRAFDLGAGYDLCQGGSWNLARGLMEVFIANGGTFVNQADVERILVDNGRATGVELTDGRVFKAGQFVASTVDVHQTFERMIGREQLPAAYTEKIDKFHYTIWTLFGLHLALNEAPRYSSTDFDPHINQALKYNIGSETIETLLSAHKEVEHNRIPSDVQFGAGALTQLDPKQAPVGKHTAYAWHLFPYEPNGDRKVPQDVLEHFAEQIIERWSEYAPNMTKKNILGKYIYTADNYTQEFPNMRYGDIFMGALTEDQVLYNHFGYRTPIEGLYMAGSPTHPNGAISGGGGYIVSSLIANDLDIKPWWKPMDVREAVGHLA
jgi:phytoene dehydrogenase-like protein